MLTRAEELKGISSLWGAGMKKCEGKVFSNGAGTAATGGYYNLVLNSELILLSVPIFFVGWNEIIEWNIQNLQDFYYVLHITLS